MKRILTACALAVGCVAGVLLSHALPTWASRNASGTYSLPTGNPVVTGTTITSTWANNTLSDLSTEMTDSLSRSGKGGMSAPLKGTNGSAAAPAYSFNSETNSGLYRAAANDLRCSVAGTDRFYVGARGVEAYGGTEVGLYGIGGTNKAGVRGDGTGNAAGLYGIGAGTGAGVLVVGGSTGLGVDATGGSGSTKSGVQGTGGSGGGDGVKGVGGGTNGIGVEGAGAGTGAGVYAWNSTALATGANDNTHPGLQVAEGHVKFSSALYPASTTAYSNYLTPSNVPKAWAKVRVNLGAVSVLGGFNIASAAVDGTFHTMIDVNLASSFTSTNYACFGTADGQIAGGVSVKSNSSSQAQLSWWTGAGFQDFTALATSDFNILCFGAQ